MTREEIIELIRDEVEHIVQQTLDQSNNPITIQVAYEILETITYLENQHDT